MASDFNPRDYGFDPNADTSFRRENKARANGLPDPELHAGFYADVTKKRFGAWIIDSIAIGLLSSLVFVFTAFVAVLVAPFIFFVISFLYRSVTIARHSSTPGMRMMGIELRNSDGNRLDGSMAFLHTLGYTVSLMITLIQLVSVGMMMAGNSGKGLTDMVLGTAMINSVSRS